jgi:ATP-dependent RNA helicase DHX37/DHR1
LYFISIYRRYDYALVGKDGKQIKNAYQSLILEDPIFIHPSSVLFKELPKYVCFIEMAETSKMYMKSLCSIEDTWLPIYLSNQCSFEKPILLNEAATDSESKMQPRYDSDKGMVMCHRESTFGKVMWKINAVEVEFPQSLDLYKWFGKFFLEGQVIDYLKKYESVLLASPSTLLKSWAK